MKKLFLFILLSMGFYICHSQVSNSRKKEHVLKLEKSNMEVYLSRDSVNNVYRSTSIWVGCNVGHTNTNEVEFRSVYFDFTRSMKLDSLFQNLYDWIKGIEEFANSNPLIGQEIRLKSDYTLKKFDSYTRIENTKINVQYTLQMNLLDIADFKKLLLNYIDQHQIRISL